MTPAPQVSVVTPNFNHARFLPELCASLAAQTPPPFEWIIVDDGSTDDSVAVVAALSRRHSFVRLVQQPRNLGVVAAMNRGVAEARGSYTVLRSADDLDLPKFHQTALALLNSHPEIGLFCGDLCYFSATPDSAVHERLAFAEKPTCFPRSQYPFLLGSRFVNGHTVMVRTELLRSCTPFLASTAMLADWFHLMVAGFRGGFCYAPITVAAARLDEQSFGNQAIQQDDSIRSCHAALLEALDGPYADVRDAFIASGSLERLGRPLAATIRADTKFANYRALAERIEHSEGAVRSTPAAALPPGPPFGLDEAILSVLSRKAAAIRDMARGPNRTRFWLYGAGGHSVALLRAWNQLGLPEFSGVVQSQGARDSFYGLPLVPLRETDFASCDLVVLSSKSFEGAMAKNLDGHATPRRLAIWNSGLDRFTPQP